MELLWSWKKFEEISGEEMHEMLALRQVVFVVEQDCVYLDADELDKLSFHLFGRNERGNLLAYARLNFRDTRYKEPSFGRILTSEKIRGSGIGKKLLEHCIEKSKDEYPELGIRISAQYYLKKFYHDFGFKTVGAPYDEDGIEHVEMILKSYD